jgi:hypothetical protein
LRQFQIRSYFQHDGNAQFIFLTFTIHAVTKKDHSFHYYKNEYLGQICPS